MGIFISFFLGIVNGFWCLVWEDYYLFLEFYYVLRKIADFMVWPSRSLKKIKSYKKSCENLNRDNKATLYKNRENKATLYKKLEKIKQRFIKIEKIKQRFIKIEKIKQHFLNWRK